MNEIIPRMPLGDWIKAGVDFLIDNFRWFFDFLRMVFDGMYTGVDFVLSTPPFYVITIVIAVLSWYLRGWKEGWRLAIGVVIGLLVIVSLNLWDHAMTSLALVIVSAFLAVVIGVPFGIWAATSETASRIIRPVLDFLQTMPAFVYLIPALILFRLGVVPGIVATITFAIAPGVRLTELGIRGVDKEVVEAGHAFGASPWRILRQIQLPLAMPSIMAGINQIIMLSLSMVVIAGMVGAGGLGGKVVEALSRVNVGLGFEAGLSVVILAIILDRMTASLAKPVAEREEA